MVKKSIISKILTAVMALSIFSTLPANEVSAQTTNEKEDINGRKIIGYFPEWAYAQESHKNYTADMIPWNQITHLNYAFAVVNPKTNKIDFGDKKAAIEMEFPGQTKDFPYKGHFNVINSKKKENPNVKSLISVGGWAGSTGFFTMCETPEGRETFANSCVDFIREYGFDGVDIDYEYPTSTKGAGNPNDFHLSDAKRAKLYEDYCEMMTLLRKKIDEASAQDNKDYLLTAAIPASSWILGGMGLAEYAETLDYVNIMTYDFHGAWNGHVGPQAALYPDERDTETKGFPMPVLNIDWAYRYFRGILPAEKINVGVPYYTRGWKNVKEGSLPGGLYGEAWISKVPGAEKGDGAVGIENIWHDKDENGKEISGGSNPLWHVKNLLENPDYKYYWDDVTKTPYVWNEKKKVFLTYEDEKSIQAKIDYVLDKNLGGIMIWELDGDYAKDANGEYTVGDTLTTYINDKFSKAPNLQPTPEKEKLPSMDYDVKFTGKYDHPNFEFDMVITNNTSVPIPAGWELEFDLPKSSFMYSAWGGDIDAGVDNGDFTRYTVTGPGWKPLNPGETHTISGAIKLCFAKGPQNFSLNGFASESEVGKVDPKPELLPLKSELKASTTESKDGNYSITLDIPANSKGEEYNIYEGTKIIKKGIIENNKQQTITSEVKNKANGNYKYKAELINKYGKTESNIIDVKVIRDEGGEGDVDVKLDFAVTNNWGNGGDWTMKVTNNTGKDINGWSIQFESNMEITNCWSGEFEKLKDGSYKVTSPSWGGTIKNGETIELKGGCTGDLDNGMIYNEAITIK